MVLSSQGLGLTSLSNEYLTVVLEIIRRSPTFLLKIFNLLQRGVSFGPRGVLVFGKWVLASTFKTALLAFIAAVVIGAIVILYQRQGVSESDVATFKETEMSKFGKLDVRQLWDWLRNQWYPRVVKQTQNVIAKITQSDVKEKLTAQINRGLETLRSKLKRRSTHVSLSRTPRTPSRRASSRRSRRQPRKLRSRSPSRSPRRRRSSR